MKKLFGMLAIGVFAAALTVSAQIRSAGTDGKKTTAAAAPATFSAKYEGGMFGFSKKESGILNLDDANQRLVFRDKKQKELFALPYGAMLVIYPQSQSARSNTGTVVGAIPLPGAGIAGMFIKEKRRYLIIQFADPDVEQARGTVSFKLENKELLNSVIETLGRANSMNQRGDAYYRKTTVSDGNKGQ
jgi:hypothetical protein